MSKLKERLLKQKKIKDKENDAIQCLKIYHALIELSGSVWSSQWLILTDVIFVGFPSSDRFYMPSKIGLIFLKGLENK